MRLVPSLLFVTMLALCGPVLAESAREISPSELRKIVNAGQAVSLKRAIDAVTASLGGEPIEARAFDAEGVFYRIVMKRSNGTLFSVIIDAGTGRQVSKDSSIGKQISTAATEGAESEKGKSTTAGNNGKGKGNGNAGGDGNAGGNGNAGGSGGGNGNGGGNGKN